MRKSYQPVFQKRFSTTVTFFEKSRWSDDRWLHLTVAETLALVDSYLSIACSLKSSEFVIRLCWGEFHKININFDNLKTFNEVKLKWQSFAIFVASLLCLRESTQDTDNHQRNE